MEKNLCKITPKVPLEGIYDDLVFAFAADKPMFLQMLDDYIDYEALMPYEFSMAFLCGFIRPRECSLEGFTRLLVLQKVLGVPTDSLMLHFLSLSVELREFYGFVKAPDAPMVTRIRKYFVGYFKAMLVKQVDIPKPICCEVNNNKADYLFYDTTGIEANFAESNPKF